MHEIDTGARGQQRQQRLLAEHPLHAAARVHGHRHRRQRLAPGPVARGGRLAVDERGEARPVRRLRRAALGSARARRPPCRRSRRARGRSGSGRCASPGRLASPTMTASRPLTIGIDARAAAEVPAGRGRVVRELLRALAARPEDSHHYVLYARRAWDGGGARQAVPLAPDRGPRPMVAPADGARGQPRVRRLPLLQLLSDRLVPAYPRRADHPRSRSLRAGDAPEPALDGHRAPDAGPRCAPLGGAVGGLPGNRRRPRRALSGGRRRTRSSRTWGWRS